MDEEMQLKITFENRDATRIFRQEERRFKLTTGASCFIKRAVHRDETPKTASLAFAGLEETSLLQDLDLEILVQSEISTHVINWYLCMYLYILVPPWWSGLVGGTTVT